MKNIYFKVTIVIILISLFLLFSLTADARVGGGHSFGGGSKSSGGSHSSGGFNWGGGSHSSSHYGGGSGGGGGCSCLLLIIIIVIIIIISNSQQKRTITSSSYVNTYSQSPYESTRKRFTMADMIRQYKQLDSNFSKPLFLDFIQLLYTKYHIARGDKLCQPLKPYISQNIINNLIRDPAERVEDVVIGVSNITNIETTMMGFDRIVVEFEANYNEHRGGRSVIYYAKERWAFQRKKGVLSKGPEEISSFHCPSCGSPDEMKPDGTCPHCSMVVNRGDFHWLLVNIVPIEKSPRPPLQFSGGGAEEGTDLPTVFQPDFDAQKRAFMMRYPNFSPQGFSQKVSDTFMKLQNAWSSCNWELARPLETDYLFSTHKYWIERYKAQGMRNCLDDIEIISITTVKIEQDAYYESITVRLKARMKDYTLDSSGRVVDGSKTRPRSFSEYWTFIRRAGFAADLKEKNSSTCPNCGGDLNISMAGICEYCGSKITSGTFDWILSTIEQDEVYEG